MGGWSPAHPKQSGSVRLGGIVDRTPHPAMPEMPLAGGPQMVEVSRDGKRVANPRPCRTNTLDFEERTR